MNIRLISQDKDLYKLCREILAESPGQEWTVTFADSLNGDGDSSLHIWDFQPKGLLPQHINGSLSKHLFLVNRKDLADFREQVKAAESNILLKPVGWLHAGAGGSSQFA